jgi:chaperonin GroEL
LYVCFKSQILFDDDAREKLLDGIHLMAKAVRSTLGPQGGTTLIESANHTRGITVTKDGVTVAKAIRFNDRVMDLAVRIMREASERTASIAGDGTTTSILLAEQLSVIGADGIQELNTTEVLRLLSKEISVCEDVLTEMSIEVTDELLYHVAKISTNNDEQMGRVIGDVYKAVGKNGIVTVESSQTHKTHYEVTNGIKIDRGYSSPMFINDQRKDECVMEGVKVLVCDGEIGNILDIEGVLREVINRRDKLLIIAPCSVNVINTMAANVVKNGLKLCNISPPSFGYRQHELMQDIALSVGATYFSEKTGDDLSLITYDDLGTASRVIVSKDNTILVRDSDIGSEVEQRISELWEQHKLLENEGERDFVLSRIASLSGGIGVIYVGGNTDLEQKELYDRVEDAVCAVRAALSDGILPGGGVALKHLSSIYSEKIKMEDTEQDFVYHMLATSLSSPFNVMLINSGLPYSDEAWSNKSPGYGMDFKTGECGNMIEMGVVDPALVTKSALRNAASVASTILSTKTIIHNTDVAPSGPIISAKKI